MTTAVMLVFLMIWISQIPQIMPEASQQARKYAAGFSFIPLGFQTGAVCLAVLGLYSAVTRRAAPILGGLIGVGLFAPAMLASILASLVLTLILVPFLKTSVWLYPATLLTPPAVLMIVAIIKRPTKTTSNNPMELTAPPRLRAEAR